MKKNYRHGDMALISIDKLPGGLKEANTKTLMRGSGNNPHTFKNGKVYFKDVDTFIFGYFVATDKTKLYHPEHGDQVKGKKLREVIIPAGIYELRRQCEDTHTQMKPVID